MKRVTVLTGNIAVGKSSSLKRAVKELENVFVYSEPLEKWKKWGDFEPLAMYYADRKKNAFPFQCFVIFTWLGGFLEALQKLPENGMLVTERSFADALEVFSRMAFDEEMISPFEFETLKELSKLVVSLMPKDVIYSVIH